MGYNCVVLVKQVPDTHRITGQVMNDDGTVNRAALPAIFNPEDLNALEMALQIKDRFGGRVTVITMGLPAATRVLRDALYRGADDAVLVTDPRCAASDTLATSYILSCAVRKLDYDIVLCGRQAIDGDTAQVGPQIAEKLHLPQVTYAGEIKKEGNTLTVQRILEDGYMTIKVQTPCVVTCIKELNTPRYMTVLGTEECWDKPLIIYDYPALQNHPLIDPTTIGLKGSPTNIFKSFTPPQKGVGMMLEGDGKDTTDKLVGMLAAKHII